MLKLIQVEFLKLRRRKFIWLMLLAALFMPLAAVFYFSSVKGTGVDPIMFYKWTCLPDADLYIPRLYPLDGEYVPTSAVQYDRYCYV